MDIHIIIFSKKVLLSIVVIKRFQSVGNVGNFSRGATPYHNFEPLDNTTHLRLTAFRFWLFISFSQPHLVSTQPP